MITQKLHGWTHYTHQYTLMHSSMNGQMEHGYHFTGVSLAQVVFFPTKANAFEHPPTSGSICPLHNQDQGFTGNGSLLAQSLWWRCVNIPKQETDLFIEAELMYSSRQFSPQHAPAASHICSNVSDQTPEETVQCVHSWDCPPRDGPFSQVINRQSESFTLWLRPQYSAYHRSSSQSHAWFCSHL